MPAEDSYGSLWSGAAPCPCSPRIEGRPGELWGEGTEGTLIMHLYIVPAKNLILFGSVFHEGAGRWHHKFILKPFNCLKLYMG